MLVSALFNRPTAGFRASGRAPASNLFSPLSIGQRVQRRGGRTRAGSFFDKVFGSSSSNQTESEQASSQDYEGGQFAPLDSSSDGGLGGSSEEVFGPLAMLAVGYLPEEFQRLQDLLIELEAEMIKLLPCTNAHLEGTLGDALSADPTPAEQLPLGTQRVIFLSGMYAAEVMEVIAFYKESGLPDPVFAAAVPNNWDRNLQELITDVYEDHKEMRQRAMAQQELQ